MVQTEVKVVLVIEVLVMMVKRKKGAYSSSWETHLRVHLPCGLTVPVTCHPTQVNTPHLNPSQASWYSIYLLRSDRRLS